MHKKEKMGAVELAAVSFGQSFQITPIQLITTAASIVNGGRRVDASFWRKSDPLGWRCCKGAFLSSGKADPVF